MLKMSAKIANYSKTRLFILKITMSAVMTAFAVVLCRFLGFPPDGAYRIELSFLPVAVVGMMFGPVWSGMSYAAADLIGAALFTGVNPFITLCKLLFGVLMGAAFYGKKRSIKFIVMFFAVTGIVVDVLCMTPIFIHFFGYTQDAAFTARIIATAVNVPARIAVFILMQKFIGSTVLSYSDKNIKREKKDELL